MSYTDEYRRKMTARRKIIEDKKIPIFVSGQVYLNERAVGKQTIYLWQLDYLPEVNSQWATSK